MAGQRSRPLQAPGQAARQNRPMKAAICSRVTELAGEYVVGDVPVVTPIALMHATAS